MAFNVIDQNGNHRGILLGRHVIDKDYFTTKSGVLWLMGLTNYRIEDLGWGLHQIEHYWAEKWKLKTGYGIDNSKFNERISRMIKTLKREGLNYEEKLRFIHTWHSWKKMKQEIESKVKVTGYLLIDPFESKYRDNKIIINMPENYPESIETSLGAPVYVKITEPPALKVSTIYHEGVTISNYYTSFKAHSGNTSFEFTLPFAVNNARKEHYMQLFFENNEPVSVYVNGLFYELERKKWSLFR